MNYQRLIAMLALLLLTCLSGCGCKHRPVYLDGTDKEVEWSELYNNRPPGKSLDVVYRHNRFYFRGYVKKIE